MSKYDGRVQVWIRQDDRKVWDALENKSEWLHEHLNGKVYTRAEVAINKDNVAFVPLLPVDTTYEPMDENA